MVEAPRTSPMRIGQLAAELGLNPKTIRYYEEIGLLPAPKRTDAGYRLYDTAALERLGFIAKAKAVGLTLEEIGEILKLRDAGERPCEHVLEVLDRKVAAVDKQLRTLADFRQELVALRNSAAQNVTTKAHVCWIIEQHEQAQPAEVGPAGNEVAADRPARSS